MENKTIRLPDVPAGRGLSRIADLTAALADLTGREVAFRFNGIDLYVSPGESDEVIHKRYEAAIAANRIDVIALNADLARALRPLVQGKGGMPITAPVGMYDMFQAALAALAQYDKAEQLPRWRHVKGGGVYEELARGHLQISDTEWDEKPCVVYRNVTNGKVWVRPSDEFDDGRFERV